MWRKGMVVSFSETENNFININQKYIEVMQTHQKKIQKMEIWNNESEDREKMFI